MPEQPRNHKDSKLVERLCADELSALRSEVQAGRGANHLKSLDERGRAQELVRDQYAGRYAFELLQNADDAMARHGNNGKVRFVLTSQALLVANSGRAFEDSEVEAICGLGRSSKTPSDSIGYKGLGFKSVAEVSDEPQIVSGEHRFYFSADRLRGAVEKIAGTPSATQRLPTYAFPWSLPDIGLRADASIVLELVKAGYATVIRLPLKRGIHRTDVAKAVQTTLLPRQLLFLRHVSLIEFMDTVDPQNNWSIGARRRKSAESVVVELTTNAQPERWNVFARRTKVERRLMAPLGPAWAKVEEVSYAVAVQLGSTGRAPVPADDPRIHAYFPTEEATGLPFVVHADFALELDRRRVARTREATAYNEWLCKKIASLTGNVVAPSFAAACGADSRVVCALLSNQTALGETGAHLRAACLRQLSVSKWLLRADGIVCKASQVVLLPRSVASLPEVFDNLDLNSSKHLLAPALQKRNEAAAALTALGCVQQWSTDTIAAHLRNPAKDNYQKFWQFILSWRQLTPDLEKSLAGRAWLLCVDQQWRSPASGPYLPRQKDVALPDGIPVPVVVLPLQNDLKLRSLLVGLGVKEFSWRELALGTLIPLLKDPETNDLMRLHGLAGLAAYLRQQRAGDERVDAAVGQVLLWSKNAEGESRELRAANTIYLAPPFAMDDRLLKIYGPFRKSEFLAEDPAVLQEAVGAELLRFLGWLGVAALPRVDAIITKGPGAGAKPANQHDHQKLGPLWTEWFQTHVATPGLSVCHEGHPNPKLSRSFALDRHAEIVESGSFERLAQLWTAVAAGWNEVYQVAMHSEFTCDHGWHPSQRVWQVPSVLAHGLRQLDWIPCLHKGRPVLRRPTEVWRNAGTLPSHVLREAALLPAELDTPQASPMSHRIGISDSAQLSIPDLVAFLKSLQMACPSPTEDMPPNIRDCARWAMRQLCRTSAPGPWPVPGTVALLARKAGFYLFANDPVVVNDPTLVRLFGGDIAILDADKDQTALTERLELADLGKLAKLHTNPHPADEQASSVLSRRTAGSLGPILALLRANVPSNYKDAPGRLQRLALTACASLDITYSYNGLSKSTASEALIVSTIDQVGNVRRRVGTAYVVVGTDGFFNFYEFGRQLAAYLDAPTLADGFAILLRDPLDSRYLASQHVREDTVHEAYAALWLQPPDEPDPLGQPLADLWALAATSTTGPETAQSASGAMPPSQAGIGGRRPLTTLPAPTPPRSLPPVDHKAVTVRDGLPAPVALPNRAPHQRLAMEPMRAGWTDFVSLQSWTTELGKRAEEIVFENEKSRLRQAGQNPDLVQLNSTINNTADHDIQSVDDDGQKRFIEVKGTTGGSAHAAFDISAAELRIARRERKRYWIYRVLRVDTATPEIVRFQDPIQMWLDGKASLSLSGANMSFGMALPETEAATT